MLLESESEYKVTMSLCKHVIDHSDVKVAVLKCLSDMVDTSPGHKVSSVYT